jgi:hypothetical protein
MTANFGLYPCNFLVFPFFYESSEHLERRFMQQVYDADSLSPVYLPVIGSTPQFQVFSVYQSSKLPGEFSFWLYPYRYSDQHPPDKLVFPLNIKGCFVLGVNTDYDAGIELQKLYLQQITASLNIMGITRFAFIVITENGEALSPNLISAIPDNAYIIPYVLNEPNAGLSKLRDFLNSMRGEILQISESENGSNFIIQHPTLSELRLLISNLGIGYRVSESFVLSFVKAFLKQSKKSRVWVEIGKKLSVDLNRDFKNVASILDNMDLGVLRNGVYVASPKVKWFRDKFVVQPASYSYIEIDETLYDSLNFYGYSRSNTADTFTAKERVYYDVIPGSTTYPDVVKFLASFDV